VRADVGVAGLMRSLYKKGLAAKDVPTVVVLCGRTRPSYISRTRPPLPTHFVYAPTSTPARPGAAWEVWARAGPRRRGVEW
jgi:hypothetical protein